MLPTEGSLLANAIGKWHGTMEWALLLVIGAHVGAAMAHTFIFRDQIMQRMLPEKPMVVRTKSLKPEVVAMKPARQSRAG
jgi:cytochrome b561